MPFQHSPPLRWTRTQDVLTPTPRVPLDGTPAVPQLRAHLDRGPVMEGAAPSIFPGRGQRRSRSFSGVVGGFPGLSRNTLKVPGEEGTEGVPAPVGASQGTRGPTLAQYNQPESSLLAIMQQITQNYNQYSSRFIL
ncbi:hypothetical protein O181_110617 [Austropuccinia psidii MF-1]|uniref:Uncharacterized protein n=1 Tax=Austropuccinia psidii MF-1 TaxID=1389203 RepID=A0A9Q3K054_9BASI|nr:hypothetical protein [Austropuccinia psidii MF-1]